MLGSESGQTNVYLGKVSHPMVYLHPWGRELASGQDPAPKILDSGQAQGSQLRQIHGLVMSFPLSYLALAGPGVDRNLQPGIQEPGNKLRGERTA